MSKCGCKQARYLSDWAPTRDLLPEMEVPGGYNTPAPTEPVYVPPVTMAPIVYVPALDSQPPSSQPPANTAPAGEAPGVYTPPATNPLAPPVHQTLLPGPGTWNPGSGIQIPGLTPGLNPTAPVTTTIPVVVDGGAPTAAKANQASLVSMPVVFALGALAIGYGAYRIYQKPARRRHR